MNTFFSVLFCYAYLLVCYDFQVVCSKKMLQNKQSVGKIHKENFELLSFVQLVRSENYCVSELYQLRVLKIYFTFRALRFIFSEGCCVWYTLLQHTISALWLKKKKNE